MQRRPLSSSRMLGIVLLSVALVSTVALQPDAGREDATQLAAASNAPWRTGAVDTTDDVGAHVSIAVDPQTGTIYMSYYDATHGDLRVARYVGSGGNCGLDQDWQCATVDSNGDVGRYSSLALDPVSGHPGVAYYDATHGALKYTAYVCIGQLCLWNSVTLDSGNPAMFSYAGRHAALAYDADRVPHITYQYAYDFPGDDELKYAHRVGSGGNCGPSNTWQCDVVDTGEGMGQYTTLTVNQERWPYVAYYDGQAGDLRYAWYWENGMGNCGGGYWQCMTLDADGDVGRHASFHLRQGSGDRNQIAYYDQTHGALKYAAFVGSDGNCGGGAWQCDEIDDALGISTDPVGIALAVDAHNTPLIAYHCPTCYCTALRAARHVGAGGNCGPSQDWQCDTIASNAGACHSLGEYVDLAFTAYDGGIIGYYDATAGDLLLAYQPAQVYLPLVGRGLMP